MTANFTVGLVRLRWHTLCAATIRVSPITAHEWQPHRRQARMTSAGRCAGERNRLRYDGRRIRNFDRRIEIAFPVIEPRLQAKLKDFLELQLADTVKGWRMQPDGNYSRSPNKDVPGLRFQERFYEILQAENRPSAATGVAID